MYEKEGNNFPHGMSFMRETGWNVLIMGIAKFVDRCTSW